MSQQLTDAFLTQFNTLNNSGMLAELETLKRENRHMRRFIEDSTALLMLTTADSMIEYISTTFLDYFIPQFMAFIIQPPREKAIVEYCYRNIGRVNEWLDVQNFHLLKEYFDEGFAERDFEKICETLGKESFSKDLLAVHPKIIFPLKGIGGIYGIAVFGEKVVPTNYSEEEYDYIAHIFNVLSVQIQNDLHYKTSITDPKTGLYTYDYFHNKLVETIAVVHRYQHQAGILMLDIDFFKKFNDTWGHLAGDKLLVSIAASMGGILRKEDCLCRFGGEEFAVLIPESDPEGLMCVAERLRRTVAETEISINGSIVSVTISVGACLISANELITPQLIIERADRALYKSKTLGRNRTTLFPEGLLRRASMHIK